MQLDGAAPEAEARPRILLVDDDQELLHGLRLVLHKQRRRWDIDFVLGGAAALEHMARRPADVIVTDMRMPEMDGATLLAHVRERYPATIRLVLSGHCDEASSRLTIGVAHRWLAKPCDPETLTAALERALMTRELLGAPGIQRLVGDLTLLPAPETIILELTELLADATCDAAAVAEVAGRDPALAARLLQLTNSVYYSPVRAIEDVRDAVMMLGFGTIAQLVVESALIGHAADGLSPSTLDALTRRARLVGRGAEVILRGHPETRTAALAGLLSGIGHLALAVMAPASFDLVYRSGAAQDAPREVIEERLFGARPARIGGALLALWGLPPRVVTTVLHHAEPSAARPSALDAVVAVHAASALVDEVLETRWGSPLDLSLLGALGLAGQLDVWRRAVEDLYARESAQRNERGAA